MLKITFKYIDKYTNGKWTTQTCIVNSLKECIQLYGLGVDCEYKILDIKRLDN